MSSVKRKPRTPSPLEDEEAAPHEIKVESLDLFAGRRVSVSEFECNELVLQQQHSVDYDVASPGASSTSSEPTYLRQPGFDSHAHEVTAGASGLAEGCSQGAKVRAQGVKGTKKKKSSPAQDLSEGDITITSIPSLASTRPRVKKGECMEIYFHFCQKK